MEKFVKVDPPMLDEIEENVVDEPCNCVSGTTRYEKLRRTVVPFKRNSEKLKSISGNDFQCSVIGNNKKKRFSGWRLCLVSLSVHVKKTCSIKEAHIRS